MAIKIEMLRCFSIVAQTGNLADAAVRLGRTQSAISMTLKQLEDHLGKRLFETDRKNRLTPLGDKVFELAQQQLLRFDETNRVIETMASAPQGLLRVASVPSMAGLIFPAAIEVLTRRHPGLQVELRDADTDQVINALLRGQADFGVVSGRHSLNGIRQVPFMEDAFGLLCAADHPLARRAAPPTIADVVAAGFVTSRLSDQIETPEIRAALSTARISVHTTFSLISMVRTGKWVTILPRSVARIFPDALAFRDIEGLSIKRSVSLLVQSRSSQIKLAEELCAIVRAGPAGQGADAPGLRSPTNPR